MPQTIAITDELARLRAENARLRSDLAMRPGSLDLLYRIREAAGLNRYTDLSLLDDHVRRMRQSLLELTDTGRIHRARQVATGGEPC